MKTEPMNLQVVHKKVAVVDSMTSAEFIRIVDEVAEQLVAREVKFRSIMPEMFP